jgi:hypothetical protein
VRRKRSAVSSISCDWRPQGVNSIRTNAYTWPPKIFAIERAEAFLGSIGTLPFCAARSSSTACVPLHCIRLLVMPPVRVVMASAEALGILIFGKSRPLTSVRLDVIDMRGNYCSTVLGAMSAIGLLNEPVSFDRLPSW